MWSLADCVEYFNTKKMIYVSYFAVRNHSERIRMMEKWCLLHFSSVCTAQKWALPYLPERPRLVDIEIYHLSPLFPTTRFAVSFLVQNPLQEVNIQKFELIAPIQAVFWFMFWDKRILSFLEFATSFYVNKIV